MFVTHDFISKIGLLCEDYFLFFEEIDWTIRGKNKNFKIGFAPNSVVYHKEGTSTGSNNNPEDFSFFADYHINRSRIIFVRKYFPHLLPLLYFRFLFAILNRMKRRQFDRIGMLLRLLVFHD
jgi:GT2 family glycosyltransferase